MATRGIHLIWTCYGTWLPGDQRGHWSALFDLYGRLREKGHRLNLPDIATRERAEALMKEPVKRLDTAEQLVVANELRKFTGALAPGMPGAKWEEAGWDRPLVVRAAAIEADHVHLLIDATSVDVTEIAGRLKSATSSAVLRIGTNAERSRTWTAGYWKVFLFDDEAMVAVQRYIEAHNERRGLNSPRFDWMSPI